MGNGTKVALVALLILMVVVVARFVRDDSRPGPAQQAGAGDKGAADARKGAGATPGAAGSRPQFVSNRVAGTQAGQLGKAPAPGVPPGNAPVASTPLRSSGLPASTATGTPLEPPSSVASPGMPPAGAAPSSSLASGSGSAAAPALGEARGLAHDAAADSGSSGLASKPGFRPILTPRPLGSGESGQARVGADGRALAQETAGAPSLLLAEGPKPPRSVESSDGESRALKSGGQPPDSTAGRSPADGRGPLDARAPASEARGPGEKSLVATTLEKGEPGRGTLAPEAAGNGAARDATTGPSWTGPSTLAGKPEGAATSTPPSGSKAPGEEGFPKSYVIVDGDSFWAVADHFYGRGNPKLVTHLMKANPGVKMQAGKKLSIPAPPPAEARSTRTGKESPPATERRPAPRLAADTGSGAKPAAGSGYREYVVKKGDTWSSIAKAFYGDDSKHRLIEDANGNLKFQMLQAGATIKVPLKAPSQQ